MYGWSKLTVGETHLFLQAADGGGALRDVPFELPDLESFARDRDWFQVVNSVLRNV